MGSCLVQRFRGEYENDGKDDGKQSESRRDAESEFHVLDEIASHRYLQWM